MTNVEKAVSRFSSNFNCAQSVLSAFSEKYGLDEKTALKLSSGFGSGVRTGEICGAVSGAVMVIGLKYGQAASADLDAKRDCYAKTEEFLRLYRERYGSIVCRELLGCNLATDEGREYAKANGLFGTVCVELVKKAVGLLEELGY